MVTKETTWQYTGRLLKADSPKRVVFGVVYEPCAQNETCELDTQQDWILPDDLQKTAWDFMERSFLAKGNTVDIQHNEEAAKVVPVESYITPVDMVVDGENGESEHIRKGSWVVGVRIKDDAIWKKVESGELNAFSIGGKGVRVPAAPS